MIYFDNAATGGFRPDSVINAATAAMEFGGGGPAPVRAQRINSCRKLLCDFLGGYSYRRTVFTKNCTEAINIALSGIFKRGDSVITTAAEHNAVLRPLRRLAGQGVKVVCVPLENGRIRAASIASAVTANTRAAVITLASNVTGYAPDIKAIRTALPESVLLICDGAQACGHIPINMRGLGIDALALSGHRGMLGVQGCGALLFSERLNPSPLIFGGNEADGYPDILECGTLNYPAIVSLGEGVMYASEHLPRHRRAMCAMTKLLVDGLAGIGGITVYSSPNPYGIVAFNIAGMAAEETAFALYKRYSICVGSGRFEAPQMCNSLCVGGVVRASLSPFNTSNECRQFLCAVAHLAQGGA